MKQKKLFYMCAAVIILTMAIAYSAFALTAEKEKSKQQVVDATEIDGIITGIKGNTVSIKGEDGLTKSVTFNNQTIFQIERIVQATPKDLKIGDEIEVTGSPAEGYGTNAERIKIEANDDLEDNKKDK
ncbi:MAG TPA: hypothetical protein DCK76_07370 [Desulfotomaculum sp.]|nr:MAG: hypothetical protein XD78_1357 [Desulfotomaculum sp. 46_296]HAG11185.1 hypothetical protein [Desulfotomaculum sp.]HBY03147.1 hypothetical protein [Desulfotomaculum sp.]